MNDHRSDDARDESAIDREIRAALSVDPSPEFVARVRSRVALEPAPTAWRLPWLLAAGGVMAAAVVIAVLVSRSGQPTEPGSVDRAPLSAKAAPDVPVTQPPAVPVEQPRAAASDVKTTPAVVGSGLPSLSAVKGSGTTDVAFKSGTEPEILISAGEARALRRLLAGIRTGTIDVRSLPPETLEVVTTLRPLDEIAPITIEPLESPVREGVQQ